MNRPDVEIMAPRKMINQSEAMFDRRRRIIQVARQIVSEEGLEAFNMRALAHRAEVSTKTIYNAFGSKEMVIALVIHAYFEEFRTTKEFRGNATSFGGALERNLASTLRAAQSPNYVRALITLFFSPTIHPAIHAVLIELTSRYWSPWLQGLEARRALRVRTR